MDEGRRMKVNIKKYFESLNPKKLGLKDEIKVSSVSKLGMGASNLNYLVKVNGGKFIFRMNMEIDKKDKSRKEFEALKIVEGHDIGPKAWVLDESKKYFDSEFIIISYIGGRTADKVAEYFKPEMFRNVGRLCGELHNIKIKGKMKSLKKESLDGYKKEVFKLKKSYLNYLNKNIGKKLMKIINESFEKMYLEVPSGRYNPNLVLSQGDFHELNVVVSRGDYKLIDFEDLQITDRASHLAHIISDFGKPFNRRQQKLFFEEYFKIVKTNKNDLIERVKIWVPIKTFSVFLWSIWHAVRVKNKVLHSAFLEKNDFKEDLKYAEIMFKRCLKMGIIDEKYKGFDIKGALR